MISGILSPWHYNKKLNLDYLHECLGVWTVVSNKVLGGRHNMIQENLPARLVVGGDCFVALAARPASCKLPIAWFDAHGDYHTLETTETGHVGGMPLAMLCGMGDLSLVASPPLSPLNQCPVWHVGGSDFDAGESERMIADGIKVSKKPSPYEAQQWVGDKGHKCHLHIDTDVLDTLVIPGSAHPVCNGMDLDSFNRMFDILIPHVQLLTIKVPDPAGDGPEGRAKSFVKSLIRRFCNAQVDV